MTVYAIIARPAWNSGLWAQVAQDYATARRSLDGTKVVVQWEGETPSRLPEGALLYYHPADPPEDTRTYAGDILTALDTPEWVDLENVPGA